MECQATAPMECQAHRFCLFRGWADSTVLDKHLVAKSGGTEYGARGGSAWNRQADASSRHDPDANRYRFVRFPDD